ncbi:MAG: hypothetical protein ACOC28_05325 [Alkalispirochaetaceae bacterium]
MKKSRILLLLGLLAFFIGCASEPEAAPEPEQPEQAEEEQESAQEEEENVPVELLAEAQELRDIIMEYDLSDFASDPFMEGEDRFTAGRNAYDDEAFEEAATELTFAIEAYEEVLDEGMPTVVDPASEEAAMARDSAREDRAHVALRSDYERVEERFNQAETDRENEEWVSALRAYQEVVPQFEDLASEAREQRDEAQTAIEQARRRLEETESRRQELESGVEEDLESAEELEEGGSE